MKIAIGADAAGFPLKEHLKAYLLEKGYGVVDCGAYDEERSHYPEFACKVAREILEGNCRFGVLCCGTGIGMSMAANKIQGIRAASVSEHYSARYTRLHNDANVLCLGSRTLGPGIAQELCDLFFTTETVGGRHADRLDMIRRIEQAGYEEFCKDTKDTEKGRRNDA